MSEHLFKKLDKIAEVQQEQAVTLERLTVSVEEHVRRTNILEEDIKPIKKHVAMIDGALKFIGIIGTIATIIGVAVELISLIIK